MSNKIIAFNNSDLALHSHVSQPVLDTGEGLGMAILPPQPVLLQPDRFSNVETVDARLSHLFTRIHESSSKQALDKAGQKMNAALKQLLAKHEIDDTQYQMWKEKAQATKTATAAYLRGAKMLTSHLEKLDQLCAGPLLGLDPEGIDLLEAQITCLEKLTQDTAAVEELQDHVQAELNEVGFAIEALERALENAESELVPSAIAAYQKAAPQERAIAHKRLAHIQGWCDACLERLPALQKRWEALTQDNDEMVSLAPLQKKALAIGARTAPFLKNAKALAVHVEERSKEELFTSLPRTEQSFFAQCCNCLAKPLRALFHPETWSDRTKEGVFRLFSLMQLSAQGARFLQDVAQFPQQVQAYYKQQWNALPKQTQEQVEKDREFLERLLCDKTWDVLQTSTLPDRVPLGREFVEQAQAHFGSKPSYAQIAAFTQKYQAARTTALLSHADAYVMQPSAMVQERFSQAEAAQNGLKTATDALTQTGHALLAAAATPSATSQEILALRKEAQLLVTTLQKTLDRCPAIESPSSPFTIWEEEMDTQCFAIKELEERIGTLTDQARSEIDRLSTDLSAYGNKHKNLVRLDRLFRAVALPGVEVPLPKGLSSPQISALITQYAPEVFTHWEMLGTHYASYTGDDFLKTPQAIELLLQIDQALSSVFDKVQEQDLPADVVQWLKKMQDKGSYLMVRSTGAEDSRKLANAGGNESPTYVDPTPQEFAKALGTVVRSYFGVNSLKNRLLGQTNPFQEPLHLPVTSQELIGEPVGGSRFPADIPISVVLFSNEPLYIGKEKFRVMRMSATYGHGEAVVGNAGVATDTALVLQSVAQPDQLYILYDNQPKPMRLAPVRMENGKVELQKVTNTPYMVKNRALSDNLIHRLFTLGLLSEKYFEDTGGTDMEIVIKGDRIYPVQARPVNRKGMTPTYLDPQKIDALSPSSIAERVQGKVVVPGSASVLELTDPEQVLVAPTLKEAERLYKPGHKLIIIEEDEPANSHPVVNFSGMGIPCLFIAKQEQMRSAVAQVSAQHPAAVCMQSGQFYLWQEPRPLSALVREGFMRHPAEIATSILGDQPLVCKGGLALQAPADLHALMTELQKTPSKRLLQTVLSHPWMQAFKTQTQALSTRQDASHIPVAQVAAALEQAIEKSVAEIDALLTPPMRAERLEILFHLKALETFLFAKPLPGSRQHSVLSLQSNFQAVQELQDYQASLAHPAHCSDILLAATMSPHPDKFTEWKTFLLQVETAVEHRQVSVEKLSQLKEMLSDLAQTDILPLFFTLFFHPQQGVDVAEQVDTLLQMRPHPAQLAALLHEQTQIDLHKQQLGGFAKPTTFEKSFEHLQKQLAPFLEEASFDRLFTAEGWEAASPITRSIALRTMDKLVDTYDLAIKEMIASTEYTQAQKDEMLKKMLMPFCDLLHRWGKSLPKADAFRRFHHQLDRIQQILNQLPVALSGGWLTYVNGAFSVRAAMLGSRSRFECNIPRTLLDVWTLIHQNHIAINAHLTDQLVDPATLFRSLPPELSQWVHALSTSTEEYLSGAKRVGIEVTETTIRVKYNVPMNNHSGSIVLMYDKTTGKTTFEGQLLGQARDRWPEIQQFLTALDTKKIIPLRKLIESGANELVFAYDLAQTGPISPLSLYQTFAKVATDDLSLGVSFMVCWQNVEKSQLLSLLDLFLENQALFTHNRGAIYKLADLFVERLATLDVHALIEWLRSKNHMQSSAAQRAVWQVIFSQLPQHELVPFIDAWRESMKSNPCLPVLRPRIAQLPPKQVARLIDTQFRSLRDQETVEEVDLFIREALATFPGNQAVLTAATTLAKKIDSIDDTTHNLWNHILAQPGSNATEAFTFYINSHHSKTLDSSHLTRVKEVDPQILGELMDQGSNAFTQNWHVEKFSQFLDQVLVSFPDNQEILTAAIKTAKKLDQNQDPDHTLWKSIFAQPHVDLVRAFKGYLLSKHKELLDLVHWNRIKEMDPQIVSGLIHHVSKYIQHYEYDQKLETFVEHAFLAFPKELFSTVVRFGEKSDQTSQRHNIWNFMLTEPTTDATEVFKHYLLSPKAVDLEEAHLKRMEEVDPKILVDLFQQAAAKGTLRKQSVLAALRYLPQSEEIVTGLIPIVGKREKRNLLDLWQQIFAHPKVDFYAAFEEFLSTDERMRNNGLLFPALEKLDPTKLDTFVHQAWANIRSYNGYYAESNLMLLLKAAIAFFPENTDLTSTGINILSEINSKKERGVSPKAEAINTAWQELWFAILAHSHIDITSVIAVLLQPHSPIISSIVEDVLTRYREKLKMIDVATLKASINEEVLNDGWRGNDAASLLIFILDILIDTSQKDPTAFVSAATHLLDQMDKSSNLRGWWQSKRQQLRERLSHLTT